MLYCTKEEVASLFGDIPDEVTDEILSTAVRNGTVWINNKLRKSFIPLPNRIVDELTTVCIYYSASDVLYSLYHGDEYKSQYDTWFQKAQEFLNDYIEAYNNNDAEQDSLISQQTVKHTRSMTYNQKRHRRRRF